PHPAAAASTARSARTQARETRPHPAAAASTARSARTPGARNASSSRRGGELLFEPLDHLHLIGVVVERVRLEDAGRAGDVDLGQPPADHVEADEKVAALAQLGTE